MNILLFLIIPNVSLALYMNTYYYQWFLHYIVIDITNNDSYIIYEQVSLATPLNDYINKYH